MEDKFLNRLEWRFAVKSLDPNKPVSGEDFAQIMKAIHFAPSSFGLQPYHVFAVTDPALLEQLRAAGYNQEKITEGSHFLIFCSRTDIAERIDEYFQMASGNDLEKRAQMKGYEDMMRGMISGKSEEQLRHWADRQTYIALGFALAACAELGVDAGPMEGFDPAAYDKILNLPPHLHSVVAMSIGHRDQEPPPPKVRYPEEDLFTFLRS